MKVNVEVTCTPEEARAFFGLPDLGPMQQLQQAFWSQLANIASGSGKKE